MFSALWCVLECSTYHTEDNTCHTKMTDQVKFSPIEIVLVHGGEVDKPETQVKRFRLETGTGQSVEARVDSIPLEEGGGNELHIRFRMPAGLDASNPPPCVVEIRVVEGDGDVRG